MWVYLYSVQCCAFKVPLLWIIFHAVNENILQSFKSESAPFIKLLSLKRKSRLWIIEMSRF